MKTLIIAVRTLKNYKLYNIINILGLALSLACTIVLSRYIYREFTVDGFNKDIDRVYAEVVEYRGDKARMSHFGNMNNESGFINPADHPSVEAITIYTPLPDDCIEYNNRKYFNITFAVDSMFLPITARQLALGNCKTALRNPGDAVITALFAKKIFGDENPMGKTVIHSTGKVFTIVGVLAEDVVKPFMNYDLLIASAKDDWSRIPHGLVKLHKGTNVYDINKAHEKYQKFRSTANREVRSQFVSYKSLYYDETLDWSYNPIYNKGDLNSMLLLIIVAIVVFVVGLFNFVNIYTVMLLKRGKEFGLKKVFGVNAAAMLKQLITENIMLVMLSVALGWVLIFASKEFLELQLNIPQMSNKKFDLMVTLSLIFIVPFITSLYPYFKYKNEVSVVSMQKMANSKSTSRIRSVLLVAQYVVSITMIIFSIYFVKQLRFMLNADLGFNTEGVIETKFVSENFSLQSGNQWRQKILEQSKLLEARFDALPIIKGWYFGSTIDDGAGSVKLKRLGGEFKEVQLSYIDKGFELVYDIHALAGRMPIDSIDRREDKNYNIWINESAAKLFNIKDCDTTLLQSNQRLFWGYGIDENYNPPFSITGVISDYKTSHLRNATTPMMYMYTSSGRPYDNLIIKFEKEKIAEGLSFLKTLYKEYAGDSDFKYNFLKDRMDLKYNDDRRVTAVLTTFAVITLIISSLGLFSLSLYDIERRYREIALRRVCGAQASQIVKMFIVKYMRQLLIAFVVASVASYILIDIYMRDFAVRTAISWWLFVVAALITALISLITLVWQTKKAADTNPATIMKTE